MTEEEIQEFIQNAFHKTAKELKENPDNVFNYLKLQEKYNEVLKDKVKLQKENQELKKQLEEINKTEIYIDTENMEERYCEGLYQDYLEKENKQLRDVLNKAKYKIERKIAFCSSEAEGYINSEKCNKTILFLKKLLDDLEEVK